MRRLAFVLLFAACDPATLSAGDAEGRDPFLPAKTPGAGGAPEQNEGPPSRGGGGDAPARPPAEPTAELVVEAPARGARALGQSLRVSGRVVNAKQPVITVNGQPAIMGEGTFHADVPVTDGMAMLITKLEDGAVTSEDHRAVLVNADQDPGSEVFDAVKIGVSAQGFQTITDLIARNAGGIDLGSLLGGAGGGGGGLAVDSVTYDDVSLVLSPDFGALKLDVSVYNLRIAVSQPAQVTASANPARITAFVALIPDGNGSLTLQIDSAEVALDDFGFSLQGLGPILTALLDSLVREFAEDMLSDALNEVVVPNLFDPAALNQKIDLLGTQLNLALAIDTVTIDPNGMVIGLAASAMPAVVQNPGKAVRPLPGPDGAVEPSELDIALAGGFVNRILHAAWAAGILNLQIGGENSSVELPLNLTAALLLPSLGEAGQGIAANAPVEIRTRGLLPPVITLVDDPERPMHVEVGDFMLDLSAEGEDLVTLAVHIGVELGIGFDEAGALKLDFGMTTHVDVAEEPRGKVNARSIETLVGGILGQLPNLLASGLAGAEGEAAEPMPAAPINLADARFLAVGAFLHILGSIDSNPIVPQPVP